LAFLKSDDLHGDQFGYRLDGRPVVRGTRILPEAIVGSYEMGESIEELRDGFPTLSLDQIRQLIELSEAQ